MKKQVKILEVGKCYRVEYFSINWYINVYEEYRNGRVLALTAIRVDDFGIEMKETLTPTIFEDITYNVIEVGKDEFFNELKTKLNEINKLISKISN